MLKRYTRIQGCLLGIGIVCAILFSPCIASSEEIITAFGDSITEGYCRGVCNGYFQVLDSIMDANGRQVGIINGGLGGERTNNGVGRIDIFLAENPTYVKNNHCPWQSQFEGKRGRIILIMEGANDAIAGISWTTTRDNLAIMIQKSKAAGVIPVIATVTPDYKYNMGSCNGGIIGAYNNAIRSLAVSEQVTLADQCNATDHDWGSLTCEGLHPTYSGDVRISNTWYNVMPGPPMLSLNGTLLLLLRQ